MVCSIRNMVLLVSVIRRVRDISNLRAISTNLVSSSDRRRRAWYIDQDDRCQKVATTGAKKSLRKSEYVFHLHFHVEGAAVGSNRVLMFEGQTEIFLF